MQLPTIPSEICALQHQDMLDLAHQLEKDLAAVRYDETLDKTEIITVWNSCFYWINRALESNPSGLMTALYRVDIPDHTLQKVIRGTDVAQELSRLVVLRCWQKVQLRRKYS